MTRIKPVKPEEAKGELKEIYQNLENKLGKVLNIFQNMGNSPATLKGFLALNEAVSQVSLSPEIREKIALIVGQTNQCNYCLSAHTAIAKGLGIQEKDILKARHGEAEDTKTKAILKFARTVVDNRGRTTNQEIAELKAAGVSDQELVEIILLIAVNMFTNYFNHITDPQIDFPIAEEIY